MSGNVGLTTPRGSGTSGFVQRNLSVVKHTRKPAYLTEAPKPVAEKKINSTIVDHDRKLQVESTVFRYQQKLQADGYVCIHTASCHFSK